MEFCAEGTLESQCSGGLPEFPEGLIKNYTRQLLEAVNELHAHGIIHRDIKGNPVTPHNA